MTWWDNDWDYRLKIKVNSDHVDTTISGVPLWVRLRDENFDFSRVTTTSGIEIRFIDSDDNQIPHEIENWNTASGIADVWVKFTSISSTEDSYVWMYYGNSTASGVPPVEVSSDIINDEFPGTTLSGIWTWDAGTGGSYTVSGSNLRITSGSGDIWGSYDPTWAYQASISGDFDIWTKLYAPDIDANYEQAGILIEVDSINFWKLARIYYSGAGGDVVYFANRVGGAGDSSYESPVAYASDTVYLRMKRVGSTVNSYYKAAEEDNWIHIAQPTNKLSSSSTVNIGLFANHPIGSQFIAEFDWIRKTALPYSTGVWSDYDVVYHLNEPVLDGSNSEVLDSSPSELHGYSSGNPPAQEDGLITYSVKFEGNDYIVSHADCGSDMSGSNYRTIYALLKPTQTNQGTWTQIWGYGATSSTNAFHMYASYNDDDTYAASQWAADFYSGVAIDTSQWVLLGMLYDGDNKLYLNKQVIFWRRAGGTPAVQVPNTSITPYRVGWNSWGSHGYLYGYVDEVRAYKGVLSDEDLKIRYLNMVEHSKIMSYLPAVVSGTLADKYGNPISGVPVKIISYDKDTLEIMDYTTVSGNGYEIGATSSGTDVLVALSFEGSFGGDTNIAGAEFRTPIIWGG